MKFKGTLIGPASGKLAGIVASHNSGGQYFRRLAIPTNPSTAFQIAVRNAFTNLAIRWRDILTEPERELWRVYAFNTPVPDRFGDPITISGLSMYIRSNTPRLQAGLPVVDVGPAVFGLADLTAPVVNSVDAGDDEAEIAFDNTDPWANDTGGALLVFASRPQNPSIQFFKGPYRLAGLVPGSSLTPPTSPADIDLPFPVSVGQKVFFQFRATNADGRLGGAIRTFQAAS